VTPSQEAVYVIQVPGEPIVNLAVPKVQSNKIINSAFSLLMKADKCRNHKKNKDLRNILESHIILYRGADGH